MLEAVLIGERAVDINHGCSRGDQIDAADVGGGCERMWGVRLLVNAEQRAQQLFGALLASAGKRDLRGLRM